MVKNPLNPRDLREILCAFTRESGVLAHSRGNKEGLQSANIIKMAGKWNNKVWFFYVKSIF